MPIVVDGIWSIVNRGVVACAWKQTQDAKMTRTADAWKQTPRDAWKQTPRDAWKLAADAAGIADRSRFVDTVDTLFAAPWAVASSALVGSGALLLCLGLRETCIRSKAVSKQDTRLESLKILEQYSFR